MNFKALLFDFDGILFDSEIYHLQACNQIFQAFDFQITEEHYFQNYVGLSDHQMIPLILTEKNIRFDSAEINRLKRAKVMAYKNIIMSYDSLESVLDVKPFIEHYASKIDSIAICSSASREEIDVVLARLEQGKLKPYFKQIISIDDLQTGKPSPEGYLLSAKRLNLEPHNCLAIEDSYTGATAAKAAGMSVAVIPSHGQVVFAQADVIAKSFYEIDSWIEVHQKSGYIN